ncbi:MAG: methyltransferase domain-containing protein, partial [Anaerolineae bacterium]|nr:methyltransferase domain-containing protein [Anaerolineae bacterium]
MDTIRETQAYYEGGVEAIYRQISGTTLHLGMFEGVDDTRQAAYARTKAFLVSHLPSLSADTTIVDLGCGYGDMGRHLAQHFGCRVIGLNLIHNQNVASAALTEAAGLSERVSTVEADFACAPLPSACTPVVWSQEAMLHAPDR